ncbi:hypothetical protein FGB62_9g111 [Gracilaria domingensis]|nr:hypothetical protein FGB62_9g111 [Gracilaria domingensis]
MNAPLDTPRRGSTWPSTWRGRTAAAGAAAPREQFCRHTRDTKNISTNFSSWDKALPAFQLVHVHTRGVPWLVATGHQRGAIAACPARAPRPRASGTTSWSYLKLAFKTADKATNTARNVRLRAELLHGDSANGLKEDEDGGQHGAVYSLALVPHEGDDVAENVQLRPVFLYRVGEGGLEESQYGGQHGAVCREALVLHDKNNLAEIRQLRVLEHVCEHAAQVGGGTKMATDGALAGHKDESSGGIAASASGVLREA